MPVPPRQLYRTSSPDKAAKPSRSKAVVPAAEVEAEFTEVNAAKRSRAQAAANLPPAGRDDLKITLRLPAPEVEHLDRIRGAFSRQDSFRLLLQAAEKLGV